MGADNKKVNLQYEPDNKLQDDQTEYAGDNIIQHDTKSPMESLINKTDWKGFEYIEYAEEDKTQSHGQGSSRDSDHGDQYADNLINYNQTWILTIHNLFRFPGGKGADNKYSGYDSKIDLQIEGMQQKK
jgi:hypothetical protein